MYFLLYQRKHERRHHTSSSFSLPIKLLAALKSLLYTASLWSGDV